MNSPQLLRAMLSPQIILRQLVRSFSLGSLEFRLAMQALERAEYAFGIKQAIYLASRLAGKRVSVLEFGVGTGGGLKLMERYAAELSAKYHFPADVYGFDLGTGLPAPRDYRDLPYTWRTGEYKMDTESVLRQLTNAKLFLGPVQETLPRFLDAKPAPIGFISFDLDYYSSTISAFRIFDADDSLLLPRILCYFDDIASDGRTLNCDYVGELLAIREFNQRSEDHHKLCRVHIREPHVKFPGPWLDRLYVYHRFSHPDYNTFIPS